MLGLRKVYMDIIDYCRTKNKQFITKAGEIITSPCCKSNYCKRCCWFRKWILLTKGAHHPTIVNCCHYYLVMPYYSPIPSNLKTKINRAFWQTVRRKYGQVAYLHGIEQQHGLVHVNYYLMTDKQIDIDFIKATWSKFLLQFAAISLKQEEDISCKTIDNKEKVLKYILKFNDNDPQSYLPEKGRYRKIYYTSPNWNQWILDRSDETLLAKFNETLN